MNVQLREYSNRSVPFSDDAVPVLRAEIERLREQNAALESEVNALRAQVAPSEWYR